MEEAPSRWAEKELANLPKELVNSPGELANSFRELVNSPGELVNSFRELVNSSRELANSLVGLGMKQSVCATASSRLGGRDVAYRRPDLRSQRAFMLMKTGF